MKRDWNRTRFDLPRTGNLVLKFIWRKHLQISLVKNICSVFKLSGVAFRLSPPYCGLPVNFNHRVPSCGELQTMFFDKTASLFLSSFDALIATEEIIEESSASQSLCCRRFGCRKLISFRLFFLRSWKKERNWRRDGDRGGGELRRGRGGRVDTWLDSCQKTSTVDVTLLLDVSVNRSTRTGLWTACGDERRGEIYSSCATTQLLCL